MNRLVTLFQMGMSIGALVACADLKEGGADSPDTYDTETEETEETSPPPSITSMMRVDSQTCSFDLSGVSDQFEMLCIADIPQSAIDSGAVHGFVQSGSEWLAMPFIEFNGGRLLYRGYFK